MSWYYARGSQQNGPVEEGELQRLVQAGELTPESLVWTTGMAEWKPYRDVFTVAAEAPVGTAGGTAPALAGVVCAECGRTFRTDEVINFSGRFVCAGCKPIYLQRMREGVEAPGEMAYATFGQRFGAKFLDGLILRIAGTVFGLLIGAAVGKLDQNGSAQVTLMIVSYVVGVALDLSYRAVFVGIWGATPGKMALKLRVVNADGSKVSHGKAWGRALAEFLSTLTIGIGYLMAAWDAEKRTLHDRICGTRVVKR